VKNYFTNTQFIGQGEDAGDGRQCKIFLPEKGSTSFSVLITACTFKLSRGHRALSNQALQSEPATFSLAKLYTKQEGRESMLSRTPHLYHELIVKISWLSLHI